MRLIDCGVSALSPQEFPHSTHTAICQAFFDAQILNKYHPGAYTEGQIIREVLICGDPRHVEVKLGWTPVFVLEMRMLYRKQQPLQMGCIKRVDGLMVRKILEVSSDVDL